MIIDKKFIPDEEVLANPDSFIEKKNNIYISKENIKVLNKYGIDINNYKNINELLFDIEEYLNNSNYELSDLEYVSEMLSEYNYYNNTNK